MCWSGLELFPFFKGCALSLVAQLLCLSFSSHRRVGERLCEIERSTWATRRLVLLAGKYAERAKVTMVSSAVGWGTATQCGAWSTGDSPRP